MKELQAIIQPFKLNEVVDALEVLPGVTGITALEVRAYGHEQGLMGVERRKTGSLHHLPKIMVLIVVEDRYVDAVLAELRTHAHSGNPGDGVVFVLPVDDVLKLRTGARGLAALK